MSSIIKSGSAPSNTADGKYFLQTDQACYAELKRGRTYIMTAQEEAKVSHYVIITNADFTVTFNGDSDLVQVGRANNAIVMNVHRACRIDFTQGGNLEFKEGTADLSSRITMGPNASGNVLVAASLPQQGDFAGQICSLTSGATYVWTGSQWSSTAGSSTLPTPTSANKYWGLVSTGSAWEAQPSAGVTKNGITASSTGIYLIPLYYNAAHNDTHFAGDIQCGVHGKRSAKCHIEVFALNGVTPSAASIMKFSSSMYWGLSSTIDLFDGIYYETVDGITKYYFGIKCENPATYFLVYYTLFNRVSDLDEAVYPTSTTPIKLTTQTKYTGTKIYTYVPQSTAANQMLVSDGNGGWTLGNRCFKALTSDQASFAGYNLKLIATRPDVAGKRHGQLGFDFTIGFHTVASFNGKLKITISSVNSGSIVPTGGITCLSYPSYRIRDNAISASNLQKITDFGSFVICWKIVDSVFYLYLGYKTTDTTVMRPNMTLDNAIGDEDWTWAGNATNTWDYNSTTLPSGLTEGIHANYIVTTATAA